MMPGSEFPDEWVMRGNHRDGWAMGAADPISGHVAMMEEARAIGELARTGWRPRRTIVYGSWDAEEPGLLGSTEWAEHHGDELREKLAIYTNTDGSGRGFLGMGGSHTLEKFLNQVAAEVEDPQFGVTLAERVRAARAVGGDAEATSRDDLRIGPLGSGSDYTPFLQHLGIASLNLGFGGESGGGSYHSQFDSFDHYTRFGDPDFAYGVTLVKTAGRVTLRFAQADVLPFQFGNFAENVALYADEVMALAGELRAEVERTNRLVGMDAYRLAADPRQTYVPPEAEEPVPHINFAPIQNALASLETSATAYDRAAAASMAAGGPSGEALTEVNALLISTERLMTRAEGLPRRPWFRHQIYAPGFYTGYGVKTLPGVREALEQKDWEEAAQFVDEVAAALDRVRGALDRATELLTDT